MYCESTIIKELGNDLYEISCCPAMCFMFEVVEYLPVGEIVSAGLELAYCTTEELWFNLSVDFTCKIVKVNQPLIDYTRKNKGKNFRYSGFEQTDWIFVVQKVGYEEDKYWHFKEHKQYDTAPITILSNTWLKYLKPYLSEIGYFNNSLPLEYYVKNFQILGEDIKRKQKICSFEYFPNYAGLGEEKWELAEKNKKTAYLHAPYDIENVYFNEKLLLKAQYNPQPNNWILMNIKEDFILKIESKVNYYTDYSCWYKYEGDFIKMGLDIQSDEYVRIHLPAYPMEYAPVGKVFINNNTMEQSQEICWVDLAGPIGRWLYPKFDMEIVAVNPKVWTNLGEPCETLTTDCYGEGWLFVVKPLDAEKTAQMFAEWKEQGKFK